MGKDNLKKLIFIYNAKGGLGNGFLDAAHKILSPKTYQCALCDLTFGVFRERRIWKEYREHASLEMVFLHKDEFLKQYASKFMPRHTFPVVLAESDHDLSVFISTEEMNSMKTPGELIALITSRTEAQG